MESTALESLLQERNSLSRQLLSSLFQITVLLLIPVLLATILGNYLHQRFGLPSLYTVCLVLLAEILSWLYIWKIYSAINTRMEELDKKIQQEKNKGAL